MKQSCLPLLAILLLLGLAPDALAQNSSTIMVAIEIDRNIPWGSKFRTDVIKAATAEIVRFMSADLKYKHWRWNSGSSPNCSGNKGYTLCLKVANFSGIGTELHLELFEDTQSLWTNPLEESIWPPGKLESEGFPSLLDDATGDILRACQVILKGFDLEAALSNYIPLAFGGEWLNEGTKGEVALPLLYNDYGYLRRSTFFVHMHSDSEPDADPVKGKGRSAEGRHSAGYTVLVVVPEAKVDRAKFLPELVKLAKYEHDSNWKKAAQKKGLTP